nr:MAG TPA: hypothetical protein [Caudoviricetes sp.]
MVAFLIRFINRKVIFQIKQSFLVHLSTVFDRYRIMNYHNFYKSSFL